MKIQLIRNATMKITYAGKVILTDPMFSKVHQIRSFAGIQKNPTVKLPFKKEEITKDIDTVLISHNHPDHFDEEANNFIKKDTLIFCQPEDEDFLKESKFENIKKIENTQSWENIKITKTGGKHGSGEILKQMGSISGFILEAKNEPKIYWLGDTIYCDEVKENIKNHNPDIIITHSGGAIIPGHEKNPLLMDTEQTIDLAKDNPNSKIIAIHLESLDHCTVSRKSLQEASRANNISKNQLFIPKDGETIEF